MEIESALREEIRLLQKQLYDVTHQKTLLITQAVRGHRFTKVIVPTKQELINWYRNEVIPSSATAEFVNSKDEEVDKNLFITILETTNV